MLLQILNLQSSKLVVFESPGCLSVWTGANLWLVVDAEHPTATYLGVTMTPRPLHPLVSGKDSRTDL